MNIVFISRWLVGGGAERFTVNIANSLCEEKNINIYIISENKRAEEYPLKNQVKRFDFLVSRKYFSNCCKILKFIKENKIDMVVGIDTEPNLLVTMCRIFTKTKCVISERNDPVHVNISKKTKFLRFLFYRNADGFVFQTNGAKSYYSKKIQSKSIIIHNPVKDDLPLKTNVDNKEIVAIGRLHMQKNYPFMLNVFKKVVDKYPDYKLRIFGEGPDFYKLNKMANDLELQKNVIFEGYSLNIHEAIKNSEIFIMTSDFEGMPNALLEAMAMGFPVVSTDCPSGGPAELIINGLNGYLCPLHDENKMVEQIVSLIENRTIKETLSRNAFEIRNSHSADVIMTCWKNYLFSLMDK